MFSGDGDIPARHEANHDAATRQDAERVAWERVLAQWRLQRNRERVRDCAWIHR